MLHSLQETKYDLLLLLFSLLQTTQVKFKQQQQQQIAQFRCESSTEER